MRYICAKCGRTEAVTTRKPHCECGGLWKLDYEPPVFSLDAVDPHEWSQFRYRRFMALDDESWRGVSMGEGWMITAEMAVLAETGTENIICTQPFGCLPNHIVAKGMARTIKNAYPNANIVAIDYDPGATRVNQENRIKLMLANAKMEQENQV